MAKRKRPVTEAQPNDVSKVSKKGTPHATQNSSSRASTRAAHYQIIAGSYDRTLHGIVATIDAGNEDRSDAEASRITFHDNFLFNAHSSAIRCIAISPISAASTDSATKITLASGGTDERVNLYHLDTSVPAEALSTVRLGGKTLENPKNKELGSLLHHSSTINALHFASKGKLLSAAGDNTIAITRTRDWTVLSSIKAPIPRAVGRPSGDTAGPGEVPMGVNDFAIHPSRKLMISVGKGEKCMRLWNLVTGKKAGVLNFEKDLLIAVGEGKWSRGEGLKVEWNAEGDEFAVAFERGVVVFSMDSEPKGIIRPFPLTKVHQLRYIAGDGGQGNVLAVSTEDGRVLFYSTKQASSITGSEETPLLQPVGQLGGKSAGFGERIKDFEILPYRRSDASEEHLVVTGSSDGSVRLWEVQKDKLREKSLKTTPASTSANKQKAATNGDEDSKGGHASLAPSIGTLLDEYSTGSRLTCLRVFEMTQPGQSATENGNGPDPSSDSETDTRDADGGDLEELKRDGSDSASDDASEDDFAGFD